MDINKEIKRLESIYLEKPERVFSMYLNTDPADPDQQGGEWRIHLKNSLQRFENYLKNDDDQDELDNFCKIKDKVRAFFDKHELELAKSVIIFATPDESIGFAEILQVPVKTQVYWDEVAAVEQLNNLAHEYPRTGIILTQREEIKIIGTELGKILDTQYYEVDIDTEDWRQHTGEHHIRSTNSTGSKSVNKRELFNKRFEANRHRWYKSIAAKLDKLAKDSGWSRIYMVGNQDETQALSSAMNKSIDTFIDKNMLDKREDIVIKTVSEYKE